MAERFRSELGRRPSVIANLLLTLQTQQSSFTKRNSPVRKHPLPEHSPEDTMTDFTSTTRGDRVAYDRYVSGPGLVFIAGAGPFRAVDPITTETAERAADLG